MDKIRIKTIMEQYDAIIHETEEFNIRKAMDSDYEAFGKIAAAEYLFGRMYEIDPKLAKKFTGILS